MAGSPRRTPGPFGKEIASLIREQLARREMTQRDLSRQADISSTQLNNYVRGRKSPTIEEFIDICDVLMVRPEVLISTALHTIEWRERNNIDDPNEVPLPDVVEWRTQARTRKNP